MNLSSLRISLLVGVAGAAGAVSRYLVSLLGVHSASVFPWPTLTVNVIGCFLLAFLFFSERLTGRWSEQVRIALSAGFLGSFTTFSAWSVETVMLWKQELQWMAGAYLLLSIGAGWFMAGLGYWSAGRDNVRYRQHREVES